MSVLLRCPVWALLRPDKCRPANDADIARAEGVGPVLLDTVRQWLGRACTVKLQPVIDPDRLQAVDAYEVPARMADALLTRSPVSALPWSSSQSRRMDVDHTIRYIPRSRGGPPGQTGVHNLGPLTRREHRFKTFGRVSVRQPVPGTFVWRTRFGRVIITNPSGTHDLGTGPFADDLWNLVGAGKRAAAA